MTSYFINEHNEDGTNFYGARIMAMKVNLCHLEIFITRL